VSAEVVDAVDDLDEAPRRTVLWVTLGVTAVLIGLFVVLIVADRGEVANPRTGEAAPVIRSTTLDGLPFDLDEQLGQWVVVNFFATWCPPCREEHPELIEFHERHRGAGDATVVSVAFDEPTEVIAEFFAEEGGDWPVVTDPDGRIAVDYGVLSVPESFLVSPNGFVVWAGTGGVTADGLDSLIDQAEAAVQGSGG
jgi:cytochrome c biogenesis protein CcmG/thiol:disulfide interchange protein DsbE